MKTAVFISGEGTNMAALAEYAQLPWCSYSVDMVAINNYHAPGIKLAESLNLNTFTAHRENFESAALDMLKIHDIDFICLAGFMQILSKEFIDQWRNRIINIHPSLLPKYKGLNTHRRVLDAGDKTHGCTIHYVTEHLDDGEIIKQESFDILENDNEFSLKYRVQELEHQMYPQVLTEIGDKFHA